MADKKLTEAEVEEVNKIITTLQGDIDKVKNHTQKKEFNEALKGIITAMGHTECPLCKEKLAVLSSKIIEAKIACKNSDAKCNLILKEAMDKADSIKSDFIPIATEKKFVKEKTKEQLHEKIKLPPFPLKFDPLHLFKNRK